MDDIADITSLKNTFEPNRFFFNLQVEPSTSGTSSTSKVAGIKRRLEPWTAEQKSVVLEFFKNHLSNKIPPKKGETITLINTYPDLLHNKSWEKIKIYVVNTYNKKK